MQEIDLRVYIRAVLKQWIWLAGFALVAAVLAYVSVSFRPNEYTATAAVVIQDIKYQINFSAGIQDAKTSPPYKAILDLANSDEVLRSVYTDSKLEETHALTLRGFKDLVLAKSGSDQSWINLSVTTDDPELAAKLANLWAQKLVDTVNRLYNPTDPSRVSAWKAELDHADLAKQEAGQALVAFQAQSQKAIIEAQLAGYYQIETDLLTSKQNLLNVQDKIVAFLSQISSIPDEQEFPAGQLTVISLQAQAVGTFASSYILSAVLPYPTVGEQRALVISIEQTINQRLPLLDKQMAELEPRILELQKQAQEIANQENNLLTQYGNLTAIYSSLSNKYSEMQLSSNLDNTLARVADEANKPLRPDGVSTAIVAVVATMAALLLGMLVIVFKTWWDLYMNHKPAETPA